MSNDLPETILTLLQERDAIAVEALPNRVGLNDDEGEDVEPIELDFSKSVHSLFPWMYYLYYIITSLIFVIPVWIALLVFQDYLTISQSLAQLDILIGKNPDVINPYVIYSQFSIILIIGSTVAFLIWFIYHPRLDIGERIQTIPTVAKFSGISILTCTLSVLVGPILWALFVFYVLFGTLLSIPIIAYGVFNRRIGLIGIGLGGPVSVVFMTMFGLTFSADPSVMIGPITGTYIASVLLVVLAPTVTVEDILDFSEWGENEYLYEYLKMFVGHIVGEKTDISNTDMDDYILKSIGGDSVIKSDMNEEVRPNLTFAIDFVERIDRMSDSIQKAENLINRGNYDEADKILSELEELVELTDERALDENIFLNSLEKTEKLKKKYKDIVKECSGIQNKFKKIREKQEFLKNKLLSIEAELDHAEDLLKENKFEKSRKALDDIEMDFSSIKGEIAEYKFEFEDISDEISEADQRRSSLLSEIDEAIEKQQELADQIGSARTKLTKTSTLIDDNKLETAEKTILSVQSQITSAQESAKKFEFRDLQEELETLDRECRNHLDSIEKKLRESERQRLQTEIKSYRANLEGINIDKKEDLEKAKAALEGLASDIDSTKETAIQYDFDDLHDDLTTLEEQRENRLEDVIERLTFKPVPEIIPRSPNISVEYDALTDREPIGGGGNADVTKATLSTPDGSVTLAIKEPRMDGTLHTDAIERMLEEAETWDKLDDHDHIVSVLDYGDAPIPWIAMEYMDGGHLGSKSGVLDMSQAFWTAIAITKGVRHAHRRGVAHLDLKPENVLFRSAEDGWDVPKVADWGLSKHLLDHSKSVEGLSPQYAAPEQFDDGYGSADDITDIYQLGAVFYELFTGQPPFDGKPAKAMHKVLHEEPTAPSEIADVPNELDEILLTALAKEKDDRYDGILYLRDELQELFDNQ